MPGKQVIFSEGIVSVLRPNDRKAAQIPAASLVAAISPHPFLGRFIIFKSVLAGWIGIPQLDYIFRIPSQAAAHVAHQWRTIKAYFYGKFPASGVVRIYLFKFFRGF